jgi:glutamyl-tRNA synthetase
MLRFAPSPTGEMHVDSLRIAILNYVVAQQKNDKFLIRIEDNDKKEIIEGKDTEIMMLLEKFALKHDAVFHQSEHLNLHQTLAIRLLKEGKAFICKCKEESNSCLADCENLISEDYEELKRSKKPFVLRLKNARDTFTILRADGTPTQTFASACDDMMSDIDFIIQTEEEKEDSPKREAIKKLLGYEKKTKYVYLPQLITDETNTFVKSLLEQGFIPDAILNYLLLLENESSTPKEIFTLPEAIEWFNIDNISTSPLKFDIEKLRFINREHLRRVDDKQLSTLFGFADADIGKLAKVYLEECCTINELEEKIRPIFKPKAFDSKEGEEMKRLSELIFLAPAFETFDELKTHLENKSGLKEETLLKPLQHLLTGTGDGPELSKIYPYIKSYILEVAS